ncbi:membrane protein insertion efficiency factor YidD [bacterium]|nr:membrane protein insertion efficiency factor YidD [bacterium]
MIARRVHLLALACALWLLLIATATAQDSDSPCALPTTSAIGAPDSLSSANAGRTTSELKLTAYAALHLYRALLSSQDGSTCNFSLSCSRYAERAIEDHGFEGVFLASDRLQRCNGLGVGFYPHDPETGKCIDPLESNVLGSSCGIRYAGYGSPGAVGREPASETARGGDRVPQPEISDAGEDRSVTDYFAPEAVRVFADYLAGHCDYTRAAAEYERYLLLSNPTNAVADSLTLRIGLLLRMAGEPLAAAEHFERVARRDAGTVMACAAVRQLAFTRWDQGRYREAIELVDARSTADDTLAAPCPTDVIAGASYLMLGEWESSIASLSAVERGANGRRGRIADDMARLALEGQEAPRKSPVAAAVMSSLLPGTGKMYAGRLLDGLFSLATISLTSWMAIEGFSEDGSSSTKGWIYGGISAWLYAGNIYGTITAVEQHNLALELAIIGEAGDLALRLSFEL